MRLRWMYMGLLGLVATTGLARAESVEDVEKSILKAAGELKSYTAKSKSVQDMDMGNGMSSKSEMSATIEWAKKGDKSLYRSEMKGTMVQKISGQEIKNESSTLIVSDGDFLYSVAETMGQKMAMKLKADPLATGAPKEMLATLKQNHDVKALPSAKVEDRDCFVLEATPKQAAGPITKTTYYFCKQTGIAVKTVSADKSGKAVMTNTLSDIKVNTEIDPKRFVFEAPAGVTVQDLTK